MPTESQLFIGLAESNTLDTTGTFEVIPSELFGTVHGYARQPVVISAETGLNVNEITFPELGRDVTVRYFGIFDRVVGGILLAVGIADPPQVGRQPHFDVGTIQLTAPFFVQPCPSATDPQQTGIILQQDGRVVGPIKQLNIAGTLADAAVSGDTGTLSPVLPFTISSLSVTPTAGEMGIPITEVTVAWAFQGRTPTGQTLNGEVIPATVRTYTFTDIELTQRTPFNLIATREGGQTTQKIAYLEFQPRIFWGLSASDHLTDLSDLSSALKSSHTGDYSYPAVNSDTYYYFAIPSSLNANSFQDITQGQPFSMASPYLLDVNGIDYKVYRSIREISTFPAIAIRVS